jgi:hypothetical protein
MAALTHEQRRRFEIVKFYGVVLRSALGWISAHTGVNDRGDTTGIAWCDRRERRGFMPADEVLRKGSMIEGRHGHA